MNARYSTLFRSHETQTRRGVLQKVIIGRSFVRKGTAVMKVHVLHQYQFVHNLSQLPNLPWQAPILSQDPDSLHTMTRFYSLPQNLR